VHEECRPDEACARRREKDESGRGRTLNLAQLHASRVGQEDGRDEEAESAERHGEPELVAVGEVVEDDGREEGAELAGGGGEAVCAR